MNTEKLRQLLNDLTYYNAAEGDQRFREMRKRFEIETELREFCRQHTIAELEESWPTDVGYLVDKNEFIIWGKE